MDDRMAMFEVTKDVTSRRGQRRGSQPADRRVYASRRWHGPRTSFPFFHVAVCRII
jgi:hypothetical protein